MSSYTIAGLPLHVLLVHAVVVLTPLTALAVILHALWPVAARRLGIVTPIAALVVLVLVPITTNAGEALEAAVPHSAAIDRHVALGNTLLPWAIALFVVSAALWLWNRYRERLEKRMPRAGARTLGIVIRVLAVLVALGTVVDVILIGDAGARAVWGGIVSG